MTTGGKLLTGLLTALFCIAYAVVSHYVVAGNDGQAWVGWLYLAQHAGVNALLGVVFGRTLIGGREPLVTRFAALVHEDMTPALLKYTRRVTMAWTLYFLATTLLSLLLFFFGPIEVWSVFVNILPLPLLAAMFVIENEVRKRVLPPEQQVGILGAIRAFRAFRAGSRP